MYALIGAHVNDIQGGLPELIGRWKGAVNVLLRPFPQMRWLHTQTKGRTVVRPFPDDSLNPDFNNPMNLIEAARVMVDRSLIRLAEFPCSHVQITNEPAISSRDAMKRMAEFDAECSRLMKPHRYAVTLANLGTGNPPRMDWWCDYQPAIAQGIVDGAVLLLHAYTWPGSDDRWLLYRHRMVYEGCPEHDWEGLPKPLWIGLFLGEIGFDIGVQEPGKHGGWRNLMNAHKYAAWLQGVNQELLKDPYVLGAAVFCCGNLDWKWTGYDIWQEPAAEVATFGTPVYRDVTVVKPEIVNLVGKLPHDEYPRRSTNKIKWTVSHHSGGTQGIITRPIRHIRAINRFHRRKGWNGIAYHFAIARDGTIYRCLQDSWVGYHCPTRNWNGRGILYIGNLLEEPPSAAQLKAGKDLTRWLGKPCVDHRDVPRNTSCPGWDIC